MFSEHWGSAIDAVVMETLAVAKFTSPPVNAAIIAQSNGFEIVRDEMQTSRGHHKSVAQKSVLFIKPDVRPERLHWAIAHEIGEAIAYRVFEVAGVSLDDPESPNREQVANRLASHLLLPTESFHETCSACNNDLVELKESFSTASHELIAMRWLDFPEPVVITILDNGQVTRRLSNGSHPGRTLMPVEQEVWRECHETGEPTETSDAELNVRVRVWPVHEETWKREILRTTPLEGFD